MDIEPLFQFFRGFRRPPMSVLSTIEMSGNNRAGHRWPRIQLDAHAFCTGVTILNLGIQGPQSGRFDWVLGDACELPFPDQSFEIVFSNSVIEHLGTTENQRRFADEVRRVGCSYYVQTPNRKFFLEPHVVTPFIHWLPRKWQGRLLRNFTLWGWITRPDADAQARYLNTTRMLNHAELCALFPKAEIWKEAFSA